MDHKHTVYTCKSKTVIRAHENKGCESESPLCVTKLLMAPLLLYSECICSVFITF